MNLSRLAEKDNTAILENSKTGFGVPVTLTVPNESEAVEAIVRLKVTGDPDTVIPAGTVYVSGESRYIQELKVTIRGEAIYPEVKAELPGAAHNLSPEDAINLDEEISGVDFVEVVQTLREGTDRDPDIVYEVTGQFIRTAVEIDPQTGLQVIGNKAAVTVSLDKFPLDQIPGNDWLVEVSDITGEVVRGRATNVTPDRTLGMVTLFIRK